ncbi:MAG: S1C family serine protease, partial [Candidatus Saccharimonadales bacterium]
LENNSTANTSGLSGPVVAPQEQKVITNQSQLISKIVDTVGPSVVSVNVTTQSQQSTGFFGFSEPVTEQAAGTGIILNSDGLIITNRHVVPAGTTSVSVTLSDGTKYNNVKVVGRTSSDDPLDIAFLQIQDTKGHTLVPASLGDSSKMEVGDQVLAIGNALGQFQNTVTTGIISGHGRSVTASDESGGSSETLQDLFQTDAAINPGNSGGPLVNMSGQVIGINTAVAGQAQNIGFAIPINDVKGLISGVEGNGKLAQPYIGVHYVPLTKDYAYVYNLPVSSGAYIAPSSQTGKQAIIPNSPAAKAGLKEKDIITKVDGTNIDKDHSLISLIDSHQPGDKVQLTIIRDGKTKVISLTLGTMPNS